MHRIRRQKFSKVLRTTNGQKFYGEFGDPNAAPRPRREVTNLPHRTLVVSKNANVSAGQMVSYGGTHFVLLDQHTLEDTKRFLVIECATKVVWSRSSKTIHPVARVERSGAPVVLDPALPVMLEPQRTQEDMGFDTQQYRVFTAADLQKGDFLNGMTVKQVYNLFGCTVAEVV